MWGDGSPRALRALGMTGQGGLMPWRCRDIRGDVGIAPYEGTQGVRSCDGGAMHPKGTCFAAWASPPTKGQEVRW